mgnify:CR=1 FL=1
MSFLNAIDVDGDSGLIGFGIGARDGKVDGGVGGKVIGFENGTEFIADGLCLFSGLVGLELQRGFESLLHAGYGASVDGGAEVGAVDVAVGGDSQRGSGGIFNQTWNNGLHILQTPLTSVTIEGEGVGEESQEGDAACAGADERLAEHLAGHFQASSWLNFRLFLLLGLLGHDYRCWNCC